MKRTVEIQLDPGVHSTISAMIAMATTFTCSEPKHGGMDEAMDASRMPWDVSAAM